MTTLSAKLQNAATEKDVEAAYRAALYQAAKSNDPAVVLNSPYQTDGVLKSELLFVLMEFKYDINMSAKGQIAMVLSQCIFYLREYAQNEPDLPSTLLVGDKNECFILPTVVVTGYIDDNDVDWSAAASDKHPVLTRKLVTDSKIQPYVLDPNSESFQVGDIIARCQSVHEGAVYRVPMSTGNISSIFQSWKESVLKNDEEPATAVNAFISSVLGNAYLHPKKPQLIFGNKNIKVSKEKHEAFFDWFEQEYAVTKKRKFTSIKDRLLEEETRRRSGDFYTPTAWVDEAHKIIDLEIGPEWREEYIVWDCSAGSANLTRDYRFDHLYLSTLYQDDVQSIKENDYHTGKEGKAFQFDFLNDPIEKAPQKLQEALADPNQNVLFLNNPPFGTASASAKNGSNKTGVSFTSVKDQMDLGRAGNQLYAQFMWRMSELADTGNVIALYSKPLFATGSSYRKFRDYFYDKWSFEDGMLFQASEFNGTSDQWGVSFTLWTHK